MENLVPCNRDELEPNPKRSKLNDETDKYRPPVCIFNFPFLQKNHCELCNSLEELRHCGERTIDPIWKNWTRINGITLCKKCFKSCTEKKDSNYRDIYILY